MEKVTDFQPDQEFFETNIDMYLRLYCERRNIEDMRKESQSIWNAALMFIRREVFRDREAFRNKNLIADTNCIMNSTCNTYNYDLIDRVCDHYIYLCMEYEKEISVLGFSNLTGIPDGTIYDWGYNPRELSRKGSEIHKKLLKYNEESLENKLVSTKANAIGLIAILNRRHGWASPYTADSNRQRTQALTADQLPQLGQTTRELPDKTQDIVDSNCKTTT